MKAKLSDSEARALVARHAEMFPTSQEDVARGQVMTGHVTIDSARVLRDALDSARLALASAVRERDEARREAATYTEKHAQWVRDIAGAVCAMVDAGIDATGAVSWDDLARVAIRDLATARSSAATAFAAGEARGREAGLEEAAKVWEESVKRNRTEAYMDGIADGRKEAAMVCERLAHNIRTGAAAAHGARECAAAIRAAGRGGA